MPNIYDSYPSEWQPLGTEPPAATGFLLEVTDHEIGLFMEISGLDMTVGVEEHQEGGVNGYTHKLPGRVTWGNITLKRGLTQDDVLMDWISQANKTGQPDQGRSTVARTTAAITVVDRFGNRLRSWEFLDVFPVRWSGPTMSVSDTNTMTESLEFAHHGFYVKQPASS